MAGVSAVWYHGTIEPAENGTLNGTGLYDSTFAEEIYGINLDYSIQYRLIVHGLKFRTDHR